MSLYQEVGIFYFPHPTSIDSNRQWMYTSWFVSVYCFCNSSRWTHLRLSVKLSIEVKCQQQFSVAREKLKDIIVSGWGGELWIFMQQATFCL